MALLEELLGLITNGVVAGIPSIVFMIIPFVLGLIVGFLLKKVLKLAIIVGIIIIALTYFGVFNLTFEGLQNLVITYGPIALHYGALLLGMLPLSLGLIVGIVIGFLIS
jgi:uncharacterized membrane protein (Fun14 family)